MSLDHLVFYERGAASLHQWAAVCPKKSRLVPSNIQRNDPHFSAESPHSNLSDKLDIDQVKKVNLHLAKVLRRRQKESGNSTMKIHVDKEYSENPMERVDVEETLTVQENGIKVAIPKQSSTPQLSQSGPGKCV